MKIKISDKETYEIEIKEVMSIQELNELLHKLNSVSKIFSRDIMSIVNNSNEPRIKRRYRSSGKREWCDSREKVLRILNIHYHGTMEEKHKVAAESGQKWDEMSKSFHGLKKRFNIIPADVGLNKFPAKGETRIKNGTTA